MCSALAPEADMAEPSRHFRVVRHEPTYAMQQNNAIHSITSSATATSDGGTVTPSVRAVSALMTSSNFEACTTGRAAGFAPLRTRPVWLGVTTGRTQREHIKSAFPPEAGRCCGHALTSESYANSGHRGSIASTSQSVELHAATKRELRGKV